MSEPKAVSTAIVVLAAGQARRMGGSAHKLLALFDGVPLIRRVVTISLASRAASVAVVTGYRRKEVEACLLDLPATLSFNAAFAEGMASSLIAGLNAPDVADKDGVMIVLGDMPGLTASHLDALISAFERADGRAIIRAASGDVPGNPVILPAAFRPALLALTGDKGAKAIIAASTLPVINVDIGSAALVDVDTPGAVLAAGGVLNG
ncbi:NTP transferase domain-containing protein [Agrobacterium vitis]|uniref:nucleotidyltransferase family protein n=1 Tax=Agrobacterium vitis TaxID=373 RepID=UPI0012E96047|nr:nucleotidyltransferase family protein [Agrobacterium vitis]MVA77916.1 NTP transferase domain-containing protein [Agrobacterium vitis]